MRVGIFSDSHGDHDALDVLLEKMGYLDAACFLGDVAKDAYYLEDRLAAMPNQPKLYAVRGNNDFACRLPVDLLVDLGGVPVYMTHGHTVVSLMSLAYRAQEKGAKIALFGHTHQALCDYVGDVMVLNPGSAGNYCRGGKARASVLEIEKGKFRVYNVMG